MKKLRHPLILTGLAALCCALPLPGPAHTETSPAELEEPEEFPRGPHGGQLVAQGDLRLELALDSSRRAKLLFLNAKGEVLPVEGHTVHGIAGQRSEPTRLKFNAARDGDNPILLSDRPLPPGDHVPMILVVSSGADTKPVTLRVMLDLD